MALNWNGNGCHRFLFLLMLLAQFRAKLYDTYCFTELCGAIVLERSKKLITKLKLFWNILNPFSNENFIMKPSRWIKKNHFWRLKKGVGSSNIYFHCNWKLSLFLQVSTTYKLESSSVEKPNLISEANSWNF